MADPVACAECGVRYDPDTSTFCPRCGSTARGGTVSPVAEAVRRSDPGRRRVQASGAVLAVLGGLMALLFAPMLFLGEGLLASTLEQVATQDPELALPGGELEVRVLDAGQPAPGVPIEVRTLAGTPVANGTTDEDGAFNASLGEHAVVEVVVAPGEANFTRRAVALEGSTTPVQVDRATDAATSAQWAGLGPLLTVVRILLAFFLAVAGLLLAAGICAMRLRAWGVAVAGGAVGVVPVLLLFVASLSVGLLLLLLVVGLPVLFIARGRRYFQGARAAPPAP